MHKQLKQNPNLIFKLPNVTDQMREYVIINCTRYLRFLSIVQYPSDKLIIWLSEKYPTRLTNLCITSEQIKLVMKTNLKAIRYLNKLEFSDIKYILSQGKKAKEYLLLGGNVSKKIWQIL